MEEREGGWERKGAEAGEGEEGGGTGGGRERRRGRWGERESEKQRHTYQQRENTEARHVTRRHQDDTQDDTRHDSRAWEHRHKTTDTRQSTTHALKARGLLHLSHKHTGAHNKWRKVGRHDKRQDSTHRHRQAQANADAGGAVGTDEQEQQHPKTSTQRRRGCQLRSPPRRMRLRYTTEPWRAGRGGWGMETFAFTRCLVLDDADLDDLSVHA